MDLAVNVITHTELFDELRYDEELAEQGDYVDREVHLREERGALRWVVVCRRHHPGEFEVGKAEEHGIEKHVRHNTEEVTRAGNLCNARPSGAADGVARLGRASDGAGRGARSGAADERSDAEERKAEKTAGHQQQICRPERRGEQDGKRRT